MSSTSPSDSLALASLNLGSSRKITTGSIGSHEHDTSVPCVRDQLKRAECSSVLLIEPRVLMRELMRECFKNCVLSPLAPEIHAVGSLAEWSASPSQHLPSVVLISCMGRPEDDEHCFQEMRDLHEMDPALPVVLIADGDRLEDVHHAIELGARGYIPTSTVPAVAIEAIRLVAAGGMYVPASCLLTARQDESPMAGFNRRKLPMFTTRQAAVVDALRRGKANKLIAYELNMRESTVKVHVRNIMKRLNAKNRTEVAYMASKLMSDDGV